MEVGAYPVVADPRFQFGWSGVTVYLNRSETKAAIQWGSWALGFLPAWRVAFIIAAVVGSPPVQDVAAWVVDRGYCLGIPHPHLMRAGPGFPRSSTTEHSRRSEPSRRRDS